MGRHRHLDLAVPAGDVHSVAAAVLFHAEAGQVVPPGEGSSAQELGQE